MTNQEVLDRVIYFTEVTAGIGDVLHVDTHPGDCDCSDVDRKDTALKDALRAAVELCMDWEQRGSYCVPINEIIEIINKELDNG